MPRGNPQNLIPVTERTKEEARKISSNGGKKSGKARRNKALLRDCVHVCVDCGFLEAHALSKRPLFDLRYGFRDFDFFKRGHGQKVHRSRDVINRSVPTCFG